MFMRFKKPARAAAPVPVALPADALAYYAREASSGPLRELSALDQMYGYWQAD
ncbi:hypothetical protein ACFP8Z_16670 [Gemmobacter lanyuensis]|nr:hypothetical protein [Gemmobacter lanyuensis]